MEGSHRCFSKEEIFGPRHKQNEQMSESSKDLGESVVSRGNHRCRGSDMGMNLMCL